MSLGDFAVSDTFPPEYKFSWLFWIIFFIGSLVSLLIILNMVIAVMSETFARVQESNDAHIMHGKIDVILNYWFRIPSSYKNKFKEFKYLVLVDIDPPFDPIKDEDSEDRIRKDVADLKKQIFNIGYYQSKSNFNL